MARLKHYREKWLASSWSSSATSNVMEVPAITKITLNMGVGEAIG
jgi:ribosomal protein L5